MNINQNRGQEEISRQREGGKEMVMDQWNLRDDSAVKSS